ncbi:hypothetical protein H0E87_002601 [Populus deltoides]|uniref:Bifunctional inhibitor/plant lipid transfer protein/seed storage helical domain-containing protein n=1 Tax=Populus deltoides TaxID=3696 RepID=A0A8T2ZWC1_POPDE|nr:hypothetical protein H0E87_002601 [Populus deltoides]
MASRKVLSLILLCTFSISCCSQSPSSAPAPSSVDCTNLILSLSDCLSFVSNDSTAAKPEGKCCAGLKTVLSTKAECLCEAFKSSAQYGIVLNVTKALSLPSVCKIHAPPASNCGLAISPSGAPAHALDVDGYKCGKWFAHRVIYAYDFAVLLRTILICLPIKYTEHRSSCCSLCVAGGSAPGPAVNGVGNEQAPAPSPGHSGSIGFSISVGSLIIGFVVASFSSF